MRWLLIGGVLSSGICFSAAAQKQTAQQDTLARSLDEAVVTAQRKETPALLAPHSVQQLNRQQIDDFNPRTTPEALMMVNGVFVQKTNHGGGSPFIRGLTGNQVLILVDGIRMNNSTFRYGPNQYLNTIDAYTIDKIEVAKGTGSVQYGTDALGGVVQVLTKEPSFSEKTQQWSGNVAGRYLSGNMEKTVRGEMQYSDKKKAIQAGVTYRDFGDLVGGDTSGKQSPSGYKELATDIKLKFLLPDNWRLCVAHQSVQQQHVPVFHKVRLENFALHEMDPQKRMLNYVKLKRSSTSRFFRQVELTASWQQSTEGRISRKNGSSMLRKEKDKVSTLGFTFDVFSKANSWWSANSGMEVYRDNVKSTRDDINEVTTVIKHLRGLYPDDSKYGNYSLYTLQHFVYNKFVAELGGRFNMFDIRIADTTVGQVRLNPSALVGNAALLYRINPHHSVYVSVSSGYRAPNIDDMGTLGIIDFRYELPAIDLKPEKSRHTEAGYKFSSSTLKGSISLYQLHLQDIITRVQLDGQILNGYRVYKKENNEKARLRGVEAALNWQIIRSLAVYAGISYAHGQNLVKNEPLRRVPPFNGRVLSTFRKNRFFTAAELVFAAKQDRLAQGDMDDNRIPQGGTPGWKLVNIYAGYQLPRLQFNIGMQNIFNKDYRTHGSGINGAGRNCFFSINLTI